MLIVIERCSRRSVCLGHFEQDAPRGFFLAGWWQLTIPSPRRSPQLRASSQRQFQRTCTGLVSMLKHGRNATRSQAGCTSTSLRERIRCTLLTGMLWASLWQRQVMSFGATLPASIGTFPINVLAKTMYRSSTIFSSHFLGYREQRRWKISRTGWPLETLGSTSARSYEHKAAYVL